MRPALRAVAARFYPRMTAFRQLDSLPRSGGAFLCQRGCGRDAVLLVMNCGTISANLELIWEMAI